MKIAKYFTATLATVATGGLYLLSNAIYKKTTPIGKHPNRISQF